MEHIYNTASKYTETMHKYNASIPTMKFVPLLIKVYNYQHENLEEKNGIGGVINANL